VCGALPRLKVQRMIALAGSLLLLAFLVALYALRRKPRPPRQEDGHDWAERRERDWYR
jgi:hypothetical protein